MKKMILMLSILIISSLIYATNGSIIAEAKVIKEIEVDIEVSDGVLDFGTLTVGSGASIVRTEMSRLKASKIQSGGNVPVVQVQASDKGDKDVLIPDYFREENIELSSTHDVSYEAAKVYVKGNWLGEAFRKIPGTKEMTSSRVYMSFDDEVVLYNEKGESIEVLIDSW